MEVILARYFNYRTNLIVPNVHWGMQMHECDLLMISAAGYATEIEIKVTRADLKKDASKRHGHFSERIKYLYFALPHYLDHCLDMVPERAGIILVEPYGDGQWGRGKRVRSPKCQKYTRKMTSLEQYKVARLGALRIWNLKEKLGEKKGPRKAP